MILGNICRKPAIKNEFQKYFYSYISNLNLIYSFKDDVYLSITLVWTAIYSCISSSKKMYSLRTSRVWVRIIGSFTLFTWHRNSPVSRGWTSLKSKKVSELYLIFIHWVYGSIGKQNSLANTFKTIIRI